VIKKIEEENQRLRLDQMKKDALEKGHPPYNEANAPKMYDKTKVRYQSR
jgi:hypothetical protein